MTQPKARKPTKAMLRAERVWKAEFARTEEHAICSFGTCAQCDSLRSAFRDGFKSALRSKERK